MIPETGFILIKYNTHYVTNKQLYQQKNLTNNAQMILNLIGPVVLVCHLGKNGSEKTISDPSAKQVVQHFGHGDTWKLVP